MAKPKRIGKANTRKRRRRLKRARKARK